MEEESSGTTTEVKTTAAGKVDVDGTLNRVRWVGLASLNTDRTRKPGERIATHAHMGVEESRQLASNNVKGEVGQA